MHFAYHIHLILVLQLFCVQAYHDRSYQQSVWSPVQLQLLNQYLEVTHLKMENARVRSQFDVEIAKSHDGSFSG